MRRRAHAARVRREQALDEILAGFPRRQPPLQIVKRNEAA
jgi:hypothetical protein